MKAKTERILARHRWLYRFGWAPTRRDVHRLFADQMGVSAGLWWSTGTVRNHIGLGLFMPVSYCMRVLPGVTSGRPQSGRTCRMCKRRRIRAVTAHEREHRDTEPAPEVTEER